MEKNAKRIRAQVACEACRRRKIRCDATNPTCWNCARSSISCVYPTDGRRKRSRASSNSPMDSTGNKDGVMRRLDRVELMLEALLEKQGIEFKESPNNDSTANSPNNESDDEFTDEKSVAVTTEASGDLVQLGDRRAPVIVKLGDGESCIIYTHGFSTALINPLRMRKLCERIGSHALGREAEKRLTMLWKRKMEISLNIMDMKGADSSQLDPYYLKRSLEFMTLTDSELVQTLLDPNDVAQVNKICCPSGDVAKIDFSLPYSLLYLSLVMVFTDSDSPFTGRDSAQYIAYQNLIAFFTSLRAFAPCCHSSFLLLRLQVMALCVIYRRAFFPQLRSFVASTLSMAYDLGLHRDEGARLLSETERKRRAVVWMLLQDFDIKLSATFSSMPLCMACDRSSDRSSLEGSGFKFREDSDLMTLQANARLNVIYVDVYNELFSIAAQHKSVKEMMLHLCEIEKRLEKWYAEMPEGMTALVNQANGAAAFEMGTVQEFPVASDIFPSPMSSSSTTSPDRKDDKPESTEEEKARILLSSAVFKRILEVSSLICFFNMRLLIHSMPVFSPSCLKVFKKVPREVQHSMEMMNHGARMLLRLTLNHTGGALSHGCMILTATTSFSTLFLKHIRDPMHPTNADDIVVIIHYVNKVKEMMSRNEVMLPSSDLIMSLWDTFVNVLSEINKERELRTRPQVPSSDQLTRPELIKQPVQPVQPKQPIQSVQPVQPVQPVQQMSPPPMQPQLAVVHPVPASVLVNPNSHPVNTQLPYGNPYINQFDSLNQLSNAAVRQHSSQLTNSQQYLGVVAPPSGITGPMDIFEKDTLWDSFNEYNGLEVDFGADFALEPTGDLDRPPNNCVIA